MARGLVGSRRRKPELLQRGQVGVDGGRRGEADRLADLAHRRREATVALVLLDDLEDLSLAGGEGDVSHGDLQGAYRCSAPYRTAPADGKHPFAGRLFDLGLDGERAFVRYPASEQAFPEHPFSRSTVTPPEENRQP